MEIASYHNLHRTSIDRSICESNTATTWPLESFTPWYLTDERLVSNELVYEALACNGFVDDDLTRSEYHQSARPSPPASRCLVQYDQDFISSVIDKQRKLRQKIIVATTSSAETLPFPHRKTATQDTVHWQSRELDNTRVS